MTRAMRLPLYVGLALSLAVPLGAGAQEQGGSREQQQQESRRPRADTETRLPPESVTRRAVDCPGAAPLELTAIAGSLALTNPEGAPQADVARGLSARRPRPATRPVTLGSMTACGLSSAYLNLLAIGLHPPRTPGRQGRTELGLALRTARRPIPRRPRGDRRGGDPAAGMGGRTGGLPRPRQPRHRRRQPRPTPHERPRRATRASPAARQLPVPLGCRHAGRLPGRGHPAHSSAGFRGPRPLPGSSRSTAATNRPPHAHGPARPRAVAEWQPWAGSTSCSANSTPSPPSYPTASSSCPASSPTHTPRCSSTAWPLSVPGSSTTTSPTCLPWPTGSSQVRPS